MAAEALFDLDAIDNICMECYTSAETQGFQGIIKRHSEDFVVTEIDGSGHIVTLDSRVIPPRPKPQTEVGETDSSRKRPSLDTVPPLKELISDKQYHTLKELADGFRQPASPILTDSIDLGCCSDKKTRSHIHVAVRGEFPVLMTQTDKDKQGGPHVCAIPDHKYLKLVEVLTKEDSEGLLLFLNTGDRDGGGTHFLTPGYTKEARTKIHLLLHELYGGLLTTHTHTAQHKRRKTTLAATPISDGTPQIAVKFRGKKQRAVNSGNKLITKFVIRKKNVETLSAIDLLSDVLECKPSQFACAGVKDKRAVTTQYMTVRDIPADRLDALTDHPLFGQIELGNFEYTSQDIKTGEHSGNHFKIVVRDVQELDGKSMTVQEIVPMTMESVEKHGFINYFGPQRFGGGLSAAKIGLAMVQGKHEKAVELILTAGISDKGPAGVARDYYTSTRDVSGTLEKMPIYKTRERYVLKALLRHGNSEFGCTCALNRIPYPWRRLYFQGFTSLLWNYLASYRVCEYGLHPVEGDLVLRGEGEASQSSKECVHVLSSHDIHDGHYSIRDVVLPCLGSSSLYPKNIVGVRLTDILASLGITLASFRMTRLGIHHTGAYRKLISYPKQLSWRWLKPEANTLSTCAAGNAKGQSELNIDKETCKDERNPQLRELNLDYSKEQLAGSETSKVTHAKPNLEVCFSLDKACYATVLLREIMKTNS